MCLFVFFFFFFLDAHNATITHLMTTTKYWTHNYISFIDYALKMLKQELCDPTMRKVRDTRILVWSNNEESQGY